jgi:hypothetical protein
MYFGQDTNTDLELLWISHQQNNTSRLGALLQISSQNDHTAQVASKHAPERSTLLQALKSMSLPFSGAWPVKMSL